MYSLCITLSAAAMLIATPSFTAAQPSGTLHDHIERAEQMVNHLLDKRPAGTTGNVAPNTGIAVKRSQIDQLHGELEMIRNAQQQAPNASGQTAGTLAEHLARARQMTLGMMNSTQQQPQASNGAANGNDEIVTIDRTKVKELQDEIEAIEGLAKQSNTNRESK